MPRPALDVWLYGCRIARLEEHAAGLRLTWSDEAAQRWPINSTVLSVLLPLIPSKHPAGPRVRAFFAGLLPEGAARTHLAVDAGVDPDDIFGMLLAYGRDVAGALVIQPESAGEPGAGHWRAIDRAEVGSKLARAASNDAPLGVTPGITSISLAGMQPKIALHRSASGQWFACEDGAPSTVILKPGSPGTRLADLIHNEAWALALARRSGLTTIEAAVEDFDGLSALVVSRYDRAVAKDGSVERLHQEDCAQMLGLNTDDPVRKFQYGRDIPSLARIAVALRRERVPLGPLLSLTTFNVAIGNTDAHAKNISVLHPRSGKMALAPAYDVSPHRHYPGSDRRNALDVAGGNDIDTTTAEDLVSEAIGWGMADGRAREVVAATLETLRDTDGRVDHREEVSDAVALTVMTRTARLLDGREAGAR